MSEHLSGHVGNTVSHDYGEFITINKMRIRREMIVCYFPAHSDATETTPERNSVNFLLTCGWNAAAVDSYEQAEKECEKLDWIYKKEGK